MAKRPQFGDIIEIETPMGLAYAQYTQNDKEVYGAMIRVLPGIYADQPKSFAHLAESKERLFAFVALGALVHGGDVAVVGNEPIPPYARSISIHAKGEPNECTEENKDLTISFSIMGLGYLVEAICSAWLPEHAPEYVGVPGRSPRERDCSTLKMLRDAGSNLALPHEVTHRIHFPYTGRKGVDRSHDNARQAAERLEHEGFEVELEKEERGWLLFAKHQVIPTWRKLRAERRFMEELSEECGGRYAAWLPKANRESGGHKARLAWLSLIRWLR